ncbi:MAG: hypothetical protein IIU00_05545, partial [Clostridia bacterium]|nr:hypothetical protein [Clostridia bacterium]
MKHQMKTYMQIYRQHKRLAGILCAVLAVAVMVAAVPMFTTHAETWKVQLDENGEAHDGSVHYKLEDGVLTVSGTGKIRYEAFYGYSGITS